MVGHLTVIGIGSAVEQQLGQLGMVSDAGGTVERTFPFWFGLVIVFIEASVGIGAGIEQSCGGFEEPFAPSSVEPEEFREAEMGQRVPVARATLGRGVCRVLGNEARNGLIVPENGGGVDVAACDFGMRGEYCLRAIERAVPDGGIDECALRVFRSGWHFRHSASLSREGPIFGIR